MTELQSKTQSPWGIIEPYQVYKCIAKMSPRLPPALASASACKSTWCRRAVGCDMSFLSAFVAFHVGHATEAPSTCAS